MTIEPSVQSLPIVAASYSNCKGQIKQRLKACFLIFDSYQFYPVRLIGFDWLVLKTTISYNFRIQDFLFSPSTHHLTNGILRITSYSIGEIVITATKRMAYIIHGASDVCIFIM